MARTTVSFQGERGAFSEMAAREMLGDNITAKPCESFEAVFDAVERRSTRYGVVPIENSLVGSIHRTYDLLLERSLHITGETQVRIIHCLLGHSNTTLKKIRHVYSHPVALDQCRSFLKAHSNMEPVPYYDTAGAARMVSEKGDAEAASIAGELAAELYGLKILKRSIEDEKSNHTRFLLLSRKPSKVTDTARTSIVFAVKNQPGALFKMLSVFALRDIDLTKIESRPVRDKKWRYYFYLDFEGSLTDPNIKRALNHLEELTSFIKVLGCYPMTVKRD